MAWVSVILDDFPSFLQAPPGMYIQDEAKLTSDNFSHFLEGFLLLGGAVPIPGGDGSSYDDLDGTIIKCPPNIQ